MSDNLTTTMTRLSAKAHRNTIPLHEPTTLIHSLHSLDAIHQRKDALCIHPRVRGSTIASRHALGVETDVETFGASIKGLASDRSTASREPARPHKTHAVILFGTGTGKLGLLGAEPNTENSGERGTHPTEWLGSGSTMSSVECR